MFYNATIDDKLRFGDVVKGYLSITPKLTKPFGNASIDIQIPQFSVILDPCCEIGGGTISLSPLEEISPQFLDIPYFSKDMTSLNRIGKAKDFFYPTRWNELSVEKKTEALIADPEYGWRSYFVYEGNPLFPEYVINRKVKYIEVTDPATNLPKYEIVREPNSFAIRHRIIDFKKSYRVDCQSIVKPERPTDQSVLGSIVLQLSKKTRNQLRDKMAYYIGKPPEEDLPDT
jgi:hypothetical protein